MEQLIAHLFFRLMGTFTPKTFCTIAIKAKQLKSIGKVIFYKPRMYRSTANTNLFSMFFTVAIDMVNRQKFFFCFATTGALVAVMLNNDFAFFLSVCASYFAPSFFISFTPSYGSFAVIQNEIRVSFFLFCVSFFLLIFANFATGKTINFGTATAINT